MPRQLTDAKKAFLISTLLDNKFVLRPPGRYDNCRYDDWAAVCYKIKAFGDTHPLIVFGSTTEDTMESLWWCLTEDEPILVQAGNGVWVARKWNDSDQEWDPVR